MEFFNNESFVHGVKSSLLSLFLLVACIIAVYNWLYLIRVFSAREDTDLHPPKNISRLVKASIFTALFTIVLIIFLFITKMY